MDEFVAFVSDLLAQADPAKVDRQKSLEERIVVPFRLIPDAAGKESCRSTDNAVRTAR
jgi:hypothetical protein